MSKLIAIGNVGSDCPYCGQQLPKRPKSKAKCPFCAQPIYVRTRPLDELRVLLRTDQLQELENQWHIDYTIKQTMRGVNHGLNKNKINSIEESQQANFEHVTKQMRNMMRDYMKMKEINFIQIVLSQSHEITDICDTHASIDMYGLGAGVYPKAKAPIPPFHYDCRYMLRPILDTII